MTLGDEVTESNLPNSTIAIMSEVFEREALTVDELLYGTESRSRSKLKIIGGKNGL